MIWLNAIMIYHDLWIIVMPSFYCVWWSKSYLSERNFSQVSFDLSGRWTKWHPNLQLLGGDSVSLTHRVENNNKPKLPINFWIFLDVCMWWAGVLYSSVFFKRPFKKSVILRWKVTFIKSWKKFHEELISPNSTCDFKIKLPGFQFLM